MTSSWGEEWRALVRKNFPGANSPYQLGADGLRKIIQSGMLGHTDLRTDPEKFFLAHRVLAQHAVELGTGNWIRLTVHYNLCVGTVLAVGNESQVAALADMQRRGQLGCFGLTERFAGVNSGLVVNTTATWNQKEGCFYMHSPDEGSYKNWISQGYTADKCCVLASLIVEGRNLGPHAFIMDLRQQGELVKGVSVGDMGKKTIGNDLDNAWIRFDQVKIPKSAFLNRYADIDENGRYVPKLKGMHTMEMIGQRLFTGRVAVAQAALTFAKQLYSETKTYTDGKRCWGPGGKRPSLSEIPQLKSLYAEAEETFSRLEKFVNSCEKDLCADLRKDTIPSKELVQAIAVAKVSCVENSIDLCHRLKQEVGSYALMYDSGFHALDFLNCCKFAEGDSRILMLKMSRDALREFGKRMKAGQKPGDSVEDKLAMKLASAMRKGGPGAWDENHETVYALAKALMSRIMISRVGPTNMKAKL